MTKTVIYKLEQREIRTLIEKYLKEQKGVTFDLKSQVRFRHSCCVCSGPTTVVSAEVEVSDELIMLKEG